MPHKRKRHVEALLKKSMSHSPITALFGHRQVGKTTLISKIAEKYVSFDVRSSLDLSEDDPESFIKNNIYSPLAIDECQLSPALFPAMKEWVRLHPKPGQILLSGSVRFSSRKAIRESLTGRYIAWELLPMDLSETHEAALPDKLARLLKSKTVETDLKIPAYGRHKELYRYLSHGGLPGIFSIRDAVTREQKIETQLETILERDLRLLVESRLSYRTLKSLLKELALIQGLPLGYSDLARRTRMSRITLSRLILAFESMFLIRIIPTKGDEKSPVVFLEDQGEASYLAENHSSVIQDLTRFTFSQLRTQQHYRPEHKIKCFQFRNRGGTLVPLCFENSLGTLGLIPIQDENPIGHSLATANSFMKQNRNAKVLFVHAGTNDRIITDKIRVLPIYKLI